MLQWYTVLDGGSDHLASFHWRVPGCMMGTTVISNSNSDSEFKRDFQEVTRGSLMTVAPSPVRKVVSNSDDDEEKVAVKRLLSFTNQSGK